MSADVSADVSAVRHRAQTQGLALAVVGLVFGCVIPDRDIDTEEIDANPGAVRIVESTNLTAAFRADCAENTTTCPQVPTGRRSGLVIMRDEQGDPLPFCVCPEGSSDERVVPEFFIYAEDPDRRGGAPKDTLYGVALRDLDPLTDEPQRFVAYEQQFEPGRQGVAFALDALPVEDLAPVDIDPESGLSLLEPSEERNTNGLTRFRFGKSGGQGTDLCNDDNGSKLEPGMHTLQVMITDRPFFRPQALDADGKPIVGLDGEPQFDARQFGMPDLAAGATWSIANYVFECIAEEPDVSEDDSVCACSPTEGA